MPKNEDKEPEVIKTSVKNVSSGMRGIHTRHGQIFLEPGESWDDVEIHAHI